MLQTGIGSGISGRKSPPEAVDFVALSLGLVNDAFALFAKAFYQIPTEEAKKQLQDLVAKLIQALDQAEKAGWDRDMIRSFIPDVISVHRESSFCRHVEDWPFGYQGDYWAIEQIVHYLEKAPAGSLGRLIGEIALESDIAEQHRAKLERQAQTIIDVCQEFSGARILSVACGSCLDIAKPEVQEVIKKTGAKVYLIDGDARAIEQAKNNLAGIKEHIEEALVMDISKPSFFKKLKKWTKDGLIFHLIYAGGLMDYVEGDEKVGKLLSMFAPLATVGGILMFTNINVGNFYAPWMRNIGSWDLFERSKKMMLKIQRFLGDAFSSSALSKDRTGLAWISQSKRIA